MRRLFVLFFVFLTGCPAPRSIDSVQYIPSTDLTTISLVMNFSKDVKSQLSDEMKTDYGLFFTKQWSKKNPFSIGALINLNIFSDHDYLSLPRTDQTPNGLPLGLPYRVAVLNGEKFISAYIDVDHYSWLGMAFLFVNDSSFPKDSSVLRVFLRDSFGDMEVFCHTFGPTESRSGGILFMANVRYLIELYGSQAVVLKPESKVSVVGQSIKKRELIQAEQKLIDLLNRY